MYTSFQTVNGRSQANQSSQQEAATPQQAAEKQQTDESAENVVSESTENVNEVEDMEDQQEEEEDDIEREDLKPITKEQQVAIAANVAKTGDDGWRKLTKMLNFEDDEVHLLLCRACQR